MNPDGTQDVNTVSIENTLNNQTLNFGEIDGSKGTAALKISTHSTNIKINSDHLIGGSENCVDLNNECKDIIIDCSLYEVKGKYAISSKTCNGVELKGHLRGHGTQWDLNFGSWSDQSSKVNQNIKISLTADSYPITYWLGNATEPIFDDKSKYKCVFKVPCGAFGRSVFMFIWSILKKIGIKI